MRLDAQGEIHNARDYRPGQAREPQAFRLIDGLLVDGHVHGQPYPPILPGGLRLSPLLGKVQPPDRGRDDLGQAQFRVRLHGFRLDADHQVGDIGLPGLEHGQPCRAIGNTLDDDALDRRLLAPVLLVGFEHELHAGSHAHESVGPEPDRLLLEGFLPNLLDVLFRYDPRRAGGGGGIERQEVRPRRLQHETHAMRIDDLDCLHPLVEQLGGGAPIAVKAELHVLGRERVTVVKPKASLSLNSYVRPSGLSRQDSARHGAMSLPGRGLASASCRA